MTKQEMQERWERLETLNEDKESELEEAYAPIQQAFHERVKLLVEYGWTYEDAYEFLLDKAELGPRGKDGSISDPNTKS